MVVSTTRPSLLVPDELEVGGSRRPVPGAFDSTQLPATPKHGFLQSFVSARELSAGSCDRQVPSEHHVGVAFCRQGACILLDTTESRIDFLSHLTPLLLPAFLSAASQITPGHAFHVGGVHMGTYLLF